MIASYDYDLSYEPAAPVIEIRIGPSGEIPKVTLKAFVDSGADATMIPIDKLKAAKARYVQMRTLSGVTGEKTTVKLYLIDVHISSRVVHGIRAVAASRGAEIILGRDVLNNLVVTLNGLASITDID